MTIYNMPIWLRKFTFKKIQQHFNEANKQNSGTSTNDINQARDILKKAEGQDPRKRGKQNQPHFSQKNSPKVNIPDFVTKATRPK